MNIKKNLKRTALSSFLLSTTSSVAFATCSPNTSPYIYDVSQGVCTQINLSAMPNNGSATIDLAINNGGNPTLWADAIINNLSITINKNITQDPGNEGAVRLDRLVNATLINNAVVSGDERGFQIGQYSTAIAPISLSLFNNKGTFNTNITNTILLNATVDSLINSGTIKNTGGGGFSWAAGLHVKGYINNLNNSGTISGNPSGIWIDTKPAGKTYTIDTLTNTGTIIATAGNLAAGYGINVNSADAGASIGTLNNYQGVSGSGGSALTYTGKLPAFYNIIISGTGYGQLAATTPTGQTTFGVSTLSTNIQPKTYSSVLTGVPSANITNPNSQVYTFGKHASLWLKQQAGSATTWDLVFQSDGRISTQFLGFDDPNVVNTYTAMNSNRQATEGILHQRYALLNALMQYDCNRFDKYGVCIQFQTRATGYGTQATGSGILNASYRIANKFRVGAYLDYQAFQGNPFGMYLGTGGVQQNNNNPSYGGYVGYSQNPDETGVQARASGGYNPGQVSVLRAVLAGTEPGYGNAGLNAYYAYGVAGYGVKIGDGLVVTPYGGIQYTDVTRSGYTEQANLLMTIYPLAYNAYYERLVTGLLGAKAKGMLTDKLGYQLSLGAQVDFTRSANSYSGYSYVPGMEIYGIAHGGGWNGVRPAGMAGVFYDPLPNHRVSLNAYTSQQAWTTRTYTTGLLGYQIAF